MPGWLHHWIVVWAAMYADSGTLRTGVGFAHIAGLLAGGGSAVVADRATLAAWRHDGAARLAHARAFHATHRIVVTSLVIVIGSGVLLLGADLDTYLHSLVFWIKMALVVLLLANGGLLVQAGRRALVGDDGAWPKLRYGAMASLTLWFVVTLLGAALPNV
jgi:small-conductance mechanosensitive channel